MFVIEVGLGQQVVERSRNTGVVVIDRDGEQDTGIGADEQAVGDEDGGALVAVLKRLCFGEVDEQVECVFLGLRAAGRVVEQDLELVVGDGFGECRPYGVVTPMAWS